MKREALLVLGMHRSGTSAVAGLLVRLGATAPATLMPADETNSEGYWESAVVCQFHDRLLTAAGSRWDSYACLDARWFQSPDAIALEAECRGLLHAEFGTAERFVLKDPRVCRFVPFWLRVLDAEAVAAAAVLVIRNPYEIAQSLEVRNGFGRNLSLLMWLRHMLDAEYATRTVRRTLVSYPDLLVHWRQVVDAMSRDLGLSWPAAETDGAAIAECLKVSLRHHCLDSTDPEDQTLLADWVRRTWSALEWLRDRDPARIADAHNILDAVRRDFDRTTKIFGSVIDPGHLDVLRKVSSLESQVDTLRQDIQSLSVEREALRQSVAALATTRRELETLVDQSRQREVVLRAEIASAQSKLVTTSDEVRALRSSLSWRITAPLRAMLRMFGYTRRFSVRR